MAFLAWSGHRGWYPAGAGRPGFGRAGFALSLQCSKGLLLGGRVRAAGGIPGLFGQGLGGALGRSKFFGKASRLLAAASSAACRARRCFWVSARAAAIAAASGQGRFSAPRQGGSGLPRRLFGVGLCGAGLLHSVCLVGALGLQLGFLAGQLFQIFLRDSAFAMRSCTSARPRRRLSCWACRAVCSSSGVRASACGPV